jgi:hypothetical protein
VVKSLQFMLSLEGLSQDDGQRSVGKRRVPVALQGNQAQLTALSEAVSNYVQRLVSSRPTDFPLKPVIPPEAPPSAPDTGLFGDEIDDHPVHLRSRTLFTHELVLGDLATSASGNSIILKVSQLYDLATALEDCAVDLQQLPVAAPATLHRRTPAWAKTAAAIVVTAGVGTATWQLLQPGFSPVPQSAKVTPGQKAPVVAISAPPLPESRARGAITLPSVALPDRSGKTFTVAQKNPGDRSTQNSDPFASSTSGANPAGTRSKGAVTFPPLPPEPPRIASNIPETASVPTNNNTASSASSAADAITPAASQPSAKAGAGAMLEAAPQSTRRTNQSNGFSTATAPAPAAAPVPALKSTPAKPSENLFDLTPQIQEARRTVESQQQRMTPSRVVEYRLSVNADGSLAAIEPLGQAAEQYLPNLSLSVGQRFVSAPGQRSRIRLVVRPDGTVQTFPEVAGN